MSCSAACGRSCRWVQGSSCDGVIAAQFQIKSLHLPLELLTALGSLGGWRARGGCWRRPRACRCSALHLPARRTCLPLRLLGRNALPEAHGTFCALLSCCVLLRSPPLQAVSVLPEWQAKQSGLPLPSFTPYPLQYITSGVDGWVRGWVCWEGVEGDIFSHSGLCPWPENPQKVSATQCKPSTTQACFWAQT